MIFYFTATGNSLYVAKHLDNELISIPQEVKKTNRHYKADSIGIVCPLFEFELPALVKKFIEESEFDTEYFYIIVTFGMHDGAVAVRTAEYLESIGRKVNYFNTIKMHDNAIIVFDMDEQRKLEEGKKVDEHIAILKKDIDERKNEIQPAGEGELEFQGYYKKMVAENGPSYTFPLFNVTESCAACGTCTKVCPGGCIQVVDKMVVYNYSTCHNCMACAQACPTKAIKLTMNEPNPEARYRNPHITLNEIISSNNQNS